MAATQDRNTSGTAARILDVAERLVQTRGFNGFSYADISAELHDINRFQTAAAGLLAGLAGAASGPA